MKRILKVVGWSAAAVVVSLVVVVVVSFSGSAPTRDGQRVAGVEAVKDGFVAAFIVDLGGPGVALIDAGMDPEGRAILTALRRRGLGPDAVKAVILTHGDGDHIAAASLFRDATVLALEPEVERVEGRVATGLLKWFRSPRPTGVRVGRALRDGETLDLAGRRVDVFAVPGHTAGSAAYLIRGVLFLGDAAEVTTDGHLTTPRRLFTRDPGLARASLVKLGQRLAPRTGEIEAIACAHSSFLPGGLGPLLALGQ